jgi:Fe-S cluster assembly iron-binding protein IscA
MPVEVTEEAIEILRRSLELGGVEPSTGGIRLRAARGLGGGIDVQVELASEASEGETTIEEDGVRIFIDPAVTEAIPDAIVTVEPQHEIVVVRPA